MNAPTNSGNPGSGRNCTVAPFLPLTMVMNVGLLTILAATSLFAADEERLALALKAQTDFERVFLSPAATLHDTNICIQTQASVLPVATPEELPLFHFRKGYCTLAAATITHESGEFLQAASEFDRAVESWAGRNAAFAKKRPPEPLPSALPVLAAIARLETGKGDGKELPTAVAAHTCAGTVVPVDRCEAILTLGREWSGWLALSHDQVDEAARQFPAGSVWTNWVAAKQAFRDRKYPEAVAAYRRAVDAWESQARAGDPPLLQRLAPPVDLSVAYTELGGAQFLAGDASGAIASLNQAIRRDGSNARALYLRGRARDAAGQSEAALADYSLASRNALAKGEDQAGEAHLYRGVSLYRRKDYAGAEDEFTNALNFDITPASRADAVAWRRLAAVASGSCDAGRRYLEESLPATSPFFPRDEARKTISSCTATRTAVLPEPVK
jgi:tetratricopeptide (TPR) repeat protein